MKFLWKQLFEFRPHSKRKRVRIKRGHRDREVNVESNYTSSWSCGYRRVSKKEPVTRSGISMTKVKVPLIRDKAAGLSPIELGSCLN